AEPGERLSRLELPIECAVISPRDPRVHLEDASRADPRVDSNRRVSFANRAPAHETDRGIEILTDLPDRRRRVPQAISPSAGQPSRLVLHISRAGAAGAGVC